MFETTYVWYPNKPLKNEPRDNEPLEIFLKIHYDPID